MRKRLLVYLVCAGLVASLCGCSQQKIDSNQTSKEVKTELEQTTNLVDDSTVQHQEEESSFFEEETTKKLANQGLIAGAVTDGVYFTEDGMMSFHLPEGFYKTDSKDLVDFVSKEYPLKADNIHFTTTENIGGLSFFTKEILESVYSESSSYSDVKVTKIENLEIDGKEAVKAVMSYKISDTKVEQTQVYIASGEFIYHLYYSKITELKVDFDACIASIRFTE